MSPPLEIAPRSICIVMLSALGDAVHVLPVVTALKRRWPGTSITWIVQPLTHQLVRGHPAVDEFVIFRRRRGLGALRSYLDLRRELKGRRFDLLLALQVYFKAGVITALVDAGTKLGFDRRRARDLNWLVTTDRVPPRPYAHVQDHYFELLEHIGVDPFPLEWQLGPNEAERAAQRAFFERIDRPVCAVVVATSKPGKNWEPARYARVIDALESKFGFRCMLVGGPAPLEREIADLVLRETRTARPLDELGDDVRRLVWLLAGSDLVISPDTGPLHIARALDVPVIGLYGYTHPKRGGPYRKYEELVVDGYARWPGEPYPADPVYRPDGMSRVTVEAVLEKVALAIERHVGRREAGAGSGEGEERG